MNKHNFNNAYDSIRDCFWIIAETLPMTPYSLDHRKACGWALLRIAHAAEWNMKKYKECGAKALRSLKGISRAEKRKALREVDLKFYHLPVHLPEFSLALIAFMADTLGPAAPLQEIQYRLEKLGWKVADAFAGVKVSHQPHPAAKETQSVYIGKSAEALRAFAAGLAAQ